ncbi:MAG: hypothetical protein KKC77_19070 [Proteobacteria bacterium]|nr:hypothetical protein [Pseudomonadota bacterium]
MADDYNSETNKGDLVYDLRQTRAKILERKLDHIDMLWVTNDYPGCFEALTNLKVWVNHQLDEKERKEYETIYSNAIIIINKYPGAFNKQDTRKESVNAIKYALTTLLEWLLDKMEDHAMFGTKEEEQGLF